ncbi:FAD-dependent monooxygenase [Subtercola sp. YIM 133946]|uniref:FAD-dependent monooxygenase n=1 Tax=Subtercola sp. YIM 133946 TaxID=3118909 RepID=UPI002F94878E
MQTFQVIVVGAGPVGLALALDLGQRGVNTLLVDRLAEPSHLPKMERVNPRTMEHFRRLGIAASIRSAGFPARLPMDVFVTTTLADPPLVHHPQPSVQTLVERGAGRNDGSMPAEPYQLISQYTLEPLLRAQVQLQGAVTTLFGWQLAGFTDHGDRVTAELTGPDGSTRVVEAAYLVGCDGGSSPVRKALGVHLRGEAHLMSLTQALIHAPDLYERIRTGRGRHYHFADEHHSFLIVQDDTKHFTLHTVVDEPDDVTARFEALVGFPVDYVVEHAAPWTMRSMVAESYGRGRVFLAGDAAHLMNPAAGLGMNTGIGDAIDIGWKLNAVLAGWAPPRLLTTYESERRPVAIANTAYSRARFDARMVWRSAVSTATVRSAAGRAHIAELADENEAQAGSMEGVELGYTYAASAQQAGIHRPYTAVASVGARLPHVWAEGGTAFQDIISQGVFTVVSVGGDDDAAAAIGAPFVAAGIPVEQLHVPSDAARRVWGADYVVVRPDLHIVWRGDEPDAGLGSVARASIGAGSESRYG